MQTHLINRLRFEIICSSDEQAMRAGADFAGNIQPILVSVIDRVCSRHIADDQWLRLDKLEITLPVLPDQFPDEALFEACFESALLERLESFTGPSEMVLFQKTTRASLLHFLRTGQLAWWDLAETTDLEAMLRELIEQQPETLRTELPLLMRNEFILRRLLFQFNPETLTKLIDCCFPELRRRIDLGALALNHQLTKPETQSTHPDNQRVILEIYLRLLPYLSDEASFQQNLPVIVNQVTGFAVSNVNVGSFPEAQISSANPISPVSTHTDERRYLVKNSGLVLLIPFLNRFFAELGWIEDSDFVDELACYKALHCLHFLATGQTHAPEHVLTLEKLLCGTPPERLVPQQIDLLEAEYQEAEALLSAVLTHWTALKNASITSLRDGFLQRDGILTFTGQGWELQVEQKTMDVLLESIPWGFSVAKLPWMPNLLYTQW